MYVHVHYYALHTLFKEKERRRMNLKTIYLLSIIIICSYTACVRACESIAYALCFGLAKMNWSKESYFKEYYWQNIIKTNVIVRRAYLYDRGEIK